MLGSFDSSILFETPLGVLMVAVVVGGITGIIGVIATNWRKVREAEQNAALKQSMVNRGMSADEIERVLKAGPAA